MSERGNVGGPYVVLVSTSTDGRGGLNGPLLRVGLMGTGSL